MKPKIIIIGGGHISPFIKQLAEADKVDCAIITPQQAHLFGQCPMPRNQLAEPEPIMLKNRIHPDTRIAFARPPKGHIRPYIYHR